MIRVLYLYPQQMNIYGDYGNVLTLIRRCQWRNIDMSVKPIEIGQTVKFLPGDIIFMGGGQDTGQARVAADLLDHAATIRVAIENGTPALTICGGYQLFGHYFVDAAGHRLDGIGVFNAHTIASKQRMIGNIVIKSAIFGQLVGFENHSGETLLATTATALGMVSKGYGNDRGRSTEGTVYKNAIGTYMHGSFLPKNPQVADWLIEKALAQCGHHQPLIRLDDSIEKQAADYAARLAS